MSVRYEVNLQGEAFDYEYYLDCCQFNDVNTLRQHEVLVREYLDMDQSYDDKLIDTYLHYHNGIVTENDINHCTIIRSPYPVAHGFVRYYGITLAIQKGSIEVLDYLVTLGWNYNDTRCINCLLSCDNKKNIKTVEYVISLPNFNINLNWFTSLLFYRCLILKRESIIQLMLSKGFNVNNTNECNENLLHHAYDDFHRGSVGIITRLTKLGVDPRALNNEGKLPIQCKK